MAPTVHITNGDSAGGGLRLACAGDAVIPWRDVLWEGPLPSCSDGDFARVRAAYLANSGHGDEAEILEDYLASFRRLTGALAAEEVVLWFEHDLHDQIQLAFLLAWFSRQARSPGTLSLICIDRFPGVAPFHGLGQLTPAQLATLLPNRLAVTPAQRVLGQEAWSALTAPAPDALNRLAAQGEAPLPFLPAAIRRYLEEYPAADSGLSRTERTILTLLAAGPAPATTLFRQVGALEPAVFMGDGSFARILHGLSAAADPLVEPPIPPRNRPGLPAIELRLTAAGVARLGPPGTPGTGWNADRWHGGVHLTPGGPAWAWEASSGHVVPLPRPTPRA